MFGMTQSATRALFGHVRRDRRTIGEYGNGPYAFGFIMN